MHSGGCVDCDPGLTSRCRPVGLGVCVEYPRGVRCARALRKDDIDTSSTSSEPHPGYFTNKDDYLKRLRRIEGQARGLQRMVSEDQYCIDILTQVSAMTKALQSVALGLLDEHLHHCVADAAAQGGDHASQKLDEATAAIARLVKA